MVWAHGCLACALLPILVGGCGTADLYLENNRVFTGRIVEGDENNVYLDRDVRQIQDGVSTRHVYQLATIPRDEINWVDHPGNGTMIAGLLSTALGIAIISANSGSCGAFTMDFTCQVSHVPVVVGVPLTLYGSFDWLSSYSSYWMKRRPPRRTIDRRPRNERAAGVDAALVRLDRVERCPAFAGSRLP